MNFRRLLVVSTILFIVCIALGLLLPINIDLESIAPFGDLVDDMDSFSSPVLFIIILINNLVAIFFVFIFSPILCITPILGIALNGLVIGVVGNMIIGEQGVLFLIAGILPHGIIEIPAVLIAFTAALNFGFATIKAVFKKQSRQKFVPSLVINGKYLALAAGMLVPAAFIEAFITPLILGLFK